MLDEGLGVIRALLSGKRVDHRGRHYVVDGVTLAPAPVQREVPIWIGGNQPASLRRAARWDGWLADSAPPRGETLTPERLRACIGAVARADAFEVAVIGDSSALTVDAYRAAGATWWLETLHDRRLALDEARGLVAAGPPSAP
jgi:alkanesulfonate monooxygenase SsuD/methylene tetrahydromethanopterin reductase-like flavin-dependent oxidoreductase (luciferase family)